MLRSDPDAYVAALVGIRTVYLEANTVVVLDRMILTCWLDDPSIQLFARIHLPIWMLRIWTYKEAVLAGQLASQLAFVLQDDKVLRLNKGEGWPSFDSKSNVAAVSLHQSLLSLRGAAMDICIIDRAFRYRLTNPRDEESFCIAGIFGVDTTEMLRGRGEERVCRFWTLLKRLPKQAASRDGPKLSIPGFRWAPRALMTTGSGLDMHFVLDDDSECTADGLVTTFGMIRDDDLPFKNDFHCIVISGTFPDGTDMELREVVLLPQRPDSAEHENITDNRVVCFDHMLFLSLLRQGPQARYSRHCDRCTAT
jgi:hypothetical protein